MACQLNEALEELKNLSEMAGMKSLKSELEDVISEVGGVMKEVPAEVESIVDTKSKPVVKRYHNGSVSSVAVDEVVLTENGYTVKYKTPIQKADREITVPLDGRMESGVEYDIRDLDSAIVENSSGVMYKINDTYQFGEGYHQANRAANKYVADMAVSAYSEADKWLSPRLREWHNEKMKKNKMYARVYSTIKDGSSNIEVINKITHTLFLTGDNPRGKVARLTKLVEDSNRSATDVLTEEMPKLDKEVLNAIPGDKEQRLLTEVYALSGYGAMSQYVIGDKTVLQLLEDGKTPKELYDMLKLDVDEKVLAKQLYGRLVNQTVQESKVVNAGSSDKVASAVVLLAMTENNGAGAKLHQKMKTKHNKLHKQLVELAVSTYTMNNMVNKGVGNLAVGNSSEYVYTDYDGHGLIDLYSNSHEFDIIELKDLDSDKYTGKLNPWKVLKKPEKGKLGIMFRKSQDVYEAGLGVNMDRIQNGLFVDRGVVQEGIEKNKNWLIDNNVQEYVTADGVKKYRMILTKELAADAEGMNNVVQSLYRSVVHNTQLIEQQTMRKMIKAELTEDGSTEAKVALLEKRLAYNKRIGRKNRKEVKPYLKTELGAELLEEKYPLVFAEYRPATGISEYEGLNQELVYVRNGLQDMMAGFRSGSVFSDSMPFLQDIERKYKQLVVLKKLKMVVASPTKLIEDLISNSAILTALDVDPIEGGKDMKEAFDYWDETSDIEAEIVRLKMELIKAESSKDKDRAKVAKERKEEAEKRLERHPFYDAYKNGFVQSMATSMMIKEFDTISGLQHTIDEVVKKVTLDDKHQPNEVHKAIVAFMNWGFSTEDVLHYAANQSKLKGTRFGDELVEMGNRLKDHKKAGQEDVPAYISEIIAGPQSEVVRQGSRVMQMGDLASRWALYKHTIKEELTAVLGREVSSKEVSDVIRGNRLGLHHKQIESIKNKAGLRSLDTFVDYRLNLPSELKKASDLGVLWFPSYWLRNAVVIPQMIAAKPLNSMVTLAVSGFAGVPTVYESHPLWKLVSDKKSLVHPGMDVATADTFIPWWP